MDSYHILVVDSKTGSNLQQTIEIQVDHSSQHTDFAVAGRFDMDFPGVIPRVIPGVARSYPEVAEVDQIVLEDQVVPGDQVVPEDQVIPKDQIVPEDHVVPKDQVLPEGMAE